VRIDAERNQVVVGDEEDLQAKGLVMRDVNCVAVPELTAASGRSRVKIRYGAPLVACLTEAEGETVRVRFARPQQAVAPGQAAVCYGADDAVAFGGVIESSW